MNYVGILVHVSASTIVLVIKVAMGVRMHINKCMKHELTLAISSNLLELAWFTGNDSIYPSQVSFQ